MRTSPRVPVTMAIVLSLVMLGIVAAEPLLVSMGVLLAGWILAQQTAFVTKTSDIEDFDISMT